MAPKGKRGKRDKLTAPAGVKSPKPSKMQKVTIQVNKPDAKEDPIVVSFPGGAPENPKDTKFIWRQLSATSATGRVIEGKDEKGTCLYRATAQGMGFDDRRTKICVGVFDKKEGTLILHQAASKGTVFALQQHLPSYKETFVEESTASRSLFEDFGTAKKRKVLKSQQANRVNVDTVIGAGSTMVESMLNPKDGNKMSESNRQAVENSRNRSSNDPKERIDPSMVSVALAQEEARKQTLPKYNKDAEKACDVYDAEKIAGLDGWKRMSRTIDAILRRGEDLCDTLTRWKPRGSDAIAVIKPEARGWTPATLDCLKRVAPLAKEAEDEETTGKSPRSTIKYQMRCVLLLKHLIKFHRTFIKGRGAPGLQDHQNIWHGIPREMATHWLSTFATPQIERNDRSIPELGTQKQESRVPWFVVAPANMDKLIIQIMLVYLMARGGKKMMVDDITPIVADLDVDIKKAGNCLRLAGATVTYVAATKKHKAELKVPLTFPQPKRGGRGRR